MHPPDRDPQWIAAYLRHWAESLDRLTTYIAQLSAPDRESPMSDLKFDYPADEPSMITTRTFDAPRQLVWQVFTRPEHVARWWGPKSIAPVKRVDKLELRPGGTWRYICERPDGSRTIVFTGKYLEVVAPERLVNTFGVEGQWEGDEAFPETHSFEERDGKTITGPTRSFPAWRCVTRCSPPAWKRADGNRFEQLAALIEEMQATAK